ncbi:DCC1-like thiol-disulfide oxidoreductase family protein [Salinirubellus sp. GCM10025818]|jgi:predicted DCC family thiol-disulfide oxidoreductase YuxK|uniref:DCC1-like thiol-disulfide oxidoreductase family protein n=1 Tax=Salinirubellus TaxID=2162630 RepID=UPI0030CB3F16
MTRTQATLVYDDDCGFCSWVASFVARRTEMGIVGFSELTDEEREPLPADYEECVHLVTEDAVYSCGEATERALERAGVLPREARTFLNQFADYGPLRERLYREAADRRDVWGLLVSAEPPTRREPSVVETEHEDDD